MPQNIVMSRQIRRPVMTTLIMAGLVLFGSGRSRTPMAPPDRRARLDALALRLPPLRDRRLHDLRRRHGLIHVADISGGRWREPLHGRDVPAAPGFERSKSLALRDDGALMQIRYVGVGPWGDDVLARALALEHAGLAPPAEPVRGGFALLPWRRGRPLRRGRKPDARIFAALVSWAARRAPLFDTGIVVDTDRFEAMLEHNAREAGVPAPAIAGAIRLLAAQPPREAVVPDAKLQPWEWLAGPAGLLKVDALEHGDDSRLPGPADAAWDVAGIAIEFGLEPGELAVLIDRTARARHEPIYEVTAAVRAWRAVYAAAGFGAAAFDLHTAGADDRPGLQAEVEFYTRALATECLRAAQAARHAAVTVSACVRRARTPSRPGRGS